MHPSGILASELFVIFHLFDLLLEPIAAALDEGCVVSAMVMAVKANACVAGVGVSAPRRLKMERLRRLMPLAVGWKAVVGDPFDMISDAMVNTGIRLCSSCGQGGGAALVSN
jgi:hypothetical protein